MLSGIAAAEGTRVAYCKPHGALYNTIARDHDQAGAVAAAITALFPGMPVLGLPGSIWLEVAEQAGLVPMVEAFADRAYAAEGNLVPRSHPGAVLQDADHIAERVVRLVTEGRITTIEGTELAFTPASICVHGDSPDAVHIAGRVRQALEDAGVQITAFAR